MARITPEDVRKVASLAKLEFGAGEETEFAAQFSRILDFVDQIGKLDTENVPPTTHAVEKKNVLRQDETRESLTPEEIGRIAPKFSGGAIIVPKIIER